LSKPKNEKFARLALTWHEEWVYLLFDFGETRVAARFEDSLKEEGACVNIRG